MAPFLAITWPNVTKFDNIRQKCSEDISNADLVFIYPEKH